MQRTSCVPGGGGEAEGGERRAVAGWRPRRWRLRLRSHDDARCGRRLHSSGGRRWRRRRCRRRRRRRRRGGDGERRVHKVGGGRGDHDPARERDGRDRQRWREEESHVRLQARLGVAEAAGEIGQADGGCGERAAAVCRLQHQKALERHGAAQRQRRRHALRQRAVQLRRRLASIRRPKARNANSAARVRPVRRLEPAGPARRPHRVAEERQGAWGGMRRGGAAGQARARQRLPRWRRARQASRVHDAHPKQLAGPYDVPPTERKQASASAQHASAWRLRHMPATSTLGGALAGCSARRAFRSASESQFRAVQTGCARARARETAGARG